MISTSRASTDSDVHYSDKMHRYEDRIFIHQRIRLVVSDPTQRQDVVHRNYPDGHVTEMFCADRTYPLSDRERQRLVQTQPTYQPMVDAMVLPDNITRHMENHPWE